MKWKTPELGHLTSSDFENIYEPAEDTFLFLDALELEEEFLLLLHPTLLFELGSGSGCIITFLGKILSKTACQLFAIDINPKACAATQKTAQMNNINIEVINGDLFTSLSKKYYKQVDVILFNPPYVPTEEEEVGSHNIEAAWAGGLFGRVVIDRLLPVISELLSENGVFYLLLEKQNKPREVQKIMANYGFSSSVVLERRSFNEYLSIVKFTRAKEIN